MRPELVEIWNGLGYKPSLFQTVVLIDVACNHESSSIINFIFPYFKLFFQLYYSIYSLYGNIFDLLFMFLFIVSAQEKPFDVHFRRIGPVLFLSKDGKVAVREGRNGRKGVYFPPESAFFFIVNMIKVLFPDCTLNWRVNNFVFRQRNGINRRNANTFFNMSFCSLWYCIYFLENVNCLL